MIALRIENNKCKVLAQCLTQRDQDFTNDYKFTECIYAPWAARMWHVQQ